eukprot:6130475-Pleurochrysis_carterae.AAC.2
MQNGSYETRASSLLGGLMLRLLTSITSFQSCVVAEFRVSSRADVVLICIFPATRNRCCPRAPPPQSTTGDTERAAAWGSSTRMAGYDAAISDRPRYISNETWSMRRVLH